MDNSIRQLLERYWVMNKYEYLYVVQGNYGQGWEDLTATTILEEAYGDETAYLMNDDQGTFRVIKRRELSK
jgi:hypothetical protein